MLEKKIVSLIKDNKRIGLFVNENSNSDVLYSVIVTYQILEKNKKNIDVFVSSNESDSNFQIFKDYGIKPKYNFDNSKYVVKINYDKYPLQKISYDIDKQNKQLLFYIYPKGNEFDFSEIEYLTGSKDYDLFILFNYSDLNDLGDIYYENPDVVNSTKKIYISRNGKIKEKENHILLDYDKNISLQIKDIFLEIFGTEDEYDEIIFKSYMSYISERKQMSNDIKSGITKELINKGNITNALKDSLMSYSKKEVQLFSKMSKRVEIDEINNIMFLSITKEDLEEIGISKEHISKLKRNPINISKEILILIEVFEIDDENLQVKISSNYPEKYSAKKIANVFEGKGSNEFSDYLVKNIKLEDFSKAFIPIFNELFHN